MRRFYAVTAVLASLLLVPALAIAQESAGSSPWEFGAGIGVGVNEPAEPFGDCNAGSTRGALSVRASYTMRPWLRIGLMASGHAELPAEQYYCLPGFTGPTYREYPARIRGSTAYLGTEARAVVTPISAETIRPLLIAGVGRIWGKGLHYPELGVGAAVPVGGLHLRFEALGRWLSVPYDLVRLEQGHELSRTSLDEEHFPVLFRIGVGWRP